MLLGKDHQNSCLERLQAGLELYDILLMLISHDHQGSSSSRKRSSLNLARSRYTPTIALSPFTHTFFHENWLPTLEISKLLSKLLILPVKWCLRDNLAFQKTTSSRRTFSSSTTLSPIRVDSASVD